MTEGFPVDDTTVSGVSAGDNSVCLNLFCKLLDINLLGLRRCCKGYHFFETAEESQKYHDVLADFIKYSKDFLCKKDSYRWLALLPFNLFKYRPDILTELACRDLVVEANLKKKAGWLASIKDIFQPKKKEEYPDDNGVWEIVNIFRYTDLTTIKNKKISVTIGIKTLDSGVKIQYLTLKLDRNTLLFFYYAKDPLIFGYNTTETQVLKDREASRIGHSCIEFAMDVILYTWIGMIIRTMNQWDYQINRVCLTYSVNPLSLI